MGFDIENFGVGLLAGWASAYGVYRARHVVKRLTTGAGDRARGAQTYATQNTDSRFVNDFVARAEKQHLAGDFVKLSDIVIEPRFVPVTVLAPWEEGDAVRDVYEIVPRIHDLPFLHAPYNIDTLSIDELATGDRALLMLGEQGSGRTTALLTIAMHSLGAVKFKAPMDKVQQKLDAEESRLSEKERATKIRERVLMEQRARERLADEKGAAFTKEDEDEGTKGLPLFSRLMPVYVHMADMVLRTTEYGPEVDPAEPLVRALQYRLGHVAASTVPGYLYNRLNKGQVLVLIDGYDDLPEHERLLYAGWLKAFMAQYKQNFVIVAGPTRGYGPLSTIGLTPVFIRPWSEQSAQRTAEYYANVWGRLGGKRKKSGSKTLDQAVLDRAKIGNAALFPPELVLKIWANYADDVEVSGVEGWLKAYIKRSIQQDARFDTLLPQMAQVAALQLDEGFITAARLQAMSIAGVETPDEETAVEEAAPAKKGRGKKGEVDTESSSAQGKLLGLLRSGGLLIRYRGDRYQFRHSFIAAYLASLTLKDASDSVKLDKASNHAWEQACAYANMHTSMEAVANARLQEAPDLLHSGLTRTARWLAYANTDVPWRTTILKNLGNLLTSPSQYPYIRERAAAALIGTRDKNVLMVFRRAVRTNDAAIRRLCCLSMGATYEAESARDLVPLMQDKDVDVQLAASMALGALHTEEAVDALLQSLTEGEEELRQAVAIAFADIPEIGYPILHEAIEDQEIMTRRAAVFGLRRLKTTWALVSIYRTFLEDEQWYVRSAAQQAFEDIQFGRSHTYTTGFPQPQALGWLAQWASARGENVPPGEGANQMLLKALQEGDPGIRKQSAGTLAQLGMAAMRPLYAALRDKQEDVRTAAHRALAELEMQIGRPLPLPL